MKKFVQELRDMLKQSKLSLNWLKFLTKKFWIYFKTHDPTTLNRQGNDIGTQYRSAIFYSDEKKFEIATKKINELQDDYVGKIVTTLEKETKFYIAEEYHHKYFSKNPYKAYCFSVIKPKVDKFKSSQK